MSWALVCSQQINRLTTEVNQDGGGLIIRRQNLR